MNLLSFAVDLLSISYFTMYNPFAHSHFDFLIYIPDRWEVVFYLLLTYEISPFFVKNSFHHDWIHSFYMRRFCTFKYPNFKYLKNLEMANLKMAHQSQYYFISFHSNFFGIVDFNCYSFILVKNQLLCFYKVNLKYYQF